jgi:hypothetical protein
MMLDQYFVGVDPGGSGGLALLSGEGELLSSPMPPTEHDVWEWFQLHARECEAAVIEKVHAMPKQGVSSTFKFGMSYGFLRGMLTASLTPFFDVTPRKWQASFGVIGVKGEARTAFKNRLKAKAQQLFPKVKVTLATADAILLAVYCKKEWTGCS